MMRSIHWTDTSTARPIGAARGFTVLEAVSALSIACLAMALVAQVGFCSLRERERFAARQVAIELAANVLEAARAQAWESLDANWAATRQIPDAARKRLADGSFTVRVESVESSPHLKRVTVEVRWMQPESVEARPVRLAALLAARTSAAAGGAP